VRKREIKMIRNKESGRKQKGIEETPHCTPYYVNLGLKSIGNHALA